MVIWMLNKDYFVLNGRDDWHAKKKNNCVQEVHPFQYVKKRLRAPYLSLKNKLPSGKLT